MRKINVIASAFILFLGFCTTPVLAITAQDEEIITKAVAAAIKAVEDSRATNNINTTEADSISVDDVLKNLDPNEQITIQNLLDLEKALNAKKTAASNLKASLLDIPATSNEATTDTSIDADLRASIQETIDNLNQQKKYNTDKTDTDTENSDSTDTSGEKIEITSISPELLMSSSEPLMQFSRSLTRKAIASVETPPETKATILLADNGENTTERVAAESYHRAADENPTSIFSTQNLIVLGISFAFMIIGIILFFVRFEKKLLTADEKFGHLNLLQKK